MVSFAFFLLAAFFLGVIAGEALRMIYLECSRCGTVIKLTDEQVNQLLVAGSLFYDCPSCSKEIPFEGSGSATPEPK